MVKYHVLAPMYLIHLLTIIHIWRNLTKKKMIHFVKLLKKCSHALTLFFFIKSEDTFIVLQCIDCKAYHVHVYAFFVFPSIFF